MKKGRHGIDNKIKKSYDTCPIIDNHVHNFKDLGQEKDKGQKGHGDKKGGDHFPENMSVDYGVYFHTVIVPLPLHMKQVRDLFGIHSK